MARSDFLAVEPKVFAAIADAVWRYDVSGRGIEPRRQILSEWLDAASRDFLHISLLCCELLQQSDLQQLSSLLVEAAKELGDQTLVRSFCRQLYKSSCEEHRSIPWSAFAPLGFSAEELRLAIDGEALYAGQVLFERFLVEQRIGRGSFGAVFKAKDQLNGKLLALKIPYGTAPDRLQQATGILRREAEVLSHFHEAGLPRFIELIEKNVERMVLVMEFVEGQTLSNIRLTPERAAECIASIAETVHELHRAGFVHRDLKPENIVVRPDGTPCILDLGLMFSERDRFANSRRYTGTLNYMAPEALSGEIEILDGRADVWSLGALLYELLSGRMLQCVDGREDAIGRAVRLDCEDISFPPNTPPRLAQICRACVWVDPLMRYDTAQMLAAVLYQWLGVERQWRCEISWDMLAGWRLGRGLSMPFVIVRDMKRWLKAMQETPDGNDVFQEQEHDCFSQAVLLGQKLWIALTRLSAYSGREGLPLPSLRITVLLNELYKKRDRTAADLWWLWCELPGVGEHLDLLDSMIATHLETVSERARACYELGIRTGLMRYGNVDIALSNLAELDEVHQQSGIDRHTWEQFKVSLSMPSLGLEQALTDLDKQVERECLFGTIPSCGGTSLTGVRL